MRLRPGTLWPAIDACIGTALRSGDLHPITTAKAVLEEAGVRFAVRILGRNERKESHAEANRRRGIDPFLPPEPELTVGAVCDTHLCVLNKFPILERHALIVTRAFEEQESYLGEADFEALALCLAGGEAFAFYNSGAAAGASQRHKHLQLVPAPLGDGPETLPVEPLLAPGRLPFRIAAERLRDLDPAHLHRRYRALLSQLDLEGPEAPSRPYNLLATRAWLAVVPRTTGAFQGVPVNALSFGGSLLARDEADLERLRAAGPLAALRAVAEPAEAGPLPAPV
jgi:ATP adenylyltransferase